MIQLSKCFLLQFVSREFLDYFLAKISNFSISCAACSDLIDFHAVLINRMFSENKRESKAPKFNSGVVSQINSMNAAGNRRSRSPFDPDSPSPLMKFLRSVDPAAGGASSPVFVTPVKVEEDVIVMDGISVPKSNSSSGEVRLRLPLMSSNSVNCSFGKSNSTASSSSSGSGGRRARAENTKSYKNKLCHYWETSRICQFGSECQVSPLSLSLTHTYAHIK